MNDTCGRHARAMAISYEKLKCFTWNNGQKFTRTIIDYRIKQEAEINNLRRYRVAFPSLYLSRCTSSLGVIKYSLQRGVEHCLREARYRFVTDRSFRRFLPAIADPDDRHLEPWWKTLANNR